MGKQSKSVEHRTQPQHARIVWPDWPSPALQALSLKRDCIGLVGLFIGALGLYLLSTPSTVMFEDDGLFISSAVFAGVGHPPGYPLFMVLGWLASHLPLGSIAWRIHGVSGVMGALTSVCIAWLVLRRTGNPWAAYLAGAMLTVSEHIWSQAIIADVYTTNTAILFLTLATIQEAVAKRDWRLWLVAAMLYGLGIANHWPLLILGSPMLLTSAIAARWDFWKRVVYLVPVTVCIAALLYGWMVWRSHHSPINFIGAIQSWGEFVAFIRRDAYVNVDTSATAGIYDKLLYIRYFAIQASLQFSVLGGLVAVFGAVYSYRNGWRLDTIGLTLTIISSSFLLIALLGFDYKYIKIAIFRPYVLVCYCILALWFGYGIDGLVKTIRITKQARLSTVIYIGFAMITVVLCVWNGRLNYRPDDNFAAEQAQIMLDLVEENSSLIAQGDPYFFPLLYLCMVENKRPDIRLLHSKGRFLNDRIVNHSWREERRHNAWITFHSNTKKPTYFTPSVHYFKTGYTHYGFVKKIHSDPTAMNITIDPNDIAKNYFIKILAMDEPSDRWGFIQRKQMIDAYGEYLGFVQLIDKTSLNDYTKDVLELAKNNRFTLKLMSWVLKAYGNEKHAQIAKVYLDRSKQLAAQHTGSQAKPD